MWSLKVHFKNFDFELKAVKTQHTAVSQEVTTERINTFSSTYVHGWTKDSTFCIRCINNWGGACVRFPVTVWETWRDFICGSVLGFFLTWAMGPVHLKENKEKTMLRFQVVRQSASHAIVFYLPTSVSPGLKETLYLRNDSLLLGHGGLCRPQ